MLSGLDIFSGIGGVTLGLSEWARPVAYCENDPYCQIVLLQRMQEGHLPQAPIWDDIQTLEGHLFQDISIIYGGFPCQDISTMGNGGGLDGQRSRLVFEMLRVAKEIKPSFIFLENVTAITTRGGLSLVREVASMGYDCRWCIIPAKATGAPHKRERWFLLAHSKSTFSKRLPSGEKKEQPKSGMCSKQKAWNSWLEGESPLLRVDDGIPHRVDRTKALGNSVVPAQVKQAFTHLLGPLR